SAFATEAALAITAEAAGRIEHVGAVDPDDARLQLRRDMQRNVDVLAPNRGGEAVAGVVGKLHRLRMVAEGHRRQDGTKHFLLRQNVCGGDVGGENRQMIPAGRGYVRFRLPAGGALTLALRDQAPDAV